MKSGRQNRGPLVESDLEGLFATDAVVRRHVRSLKLARPLAAEIAPEFFGEGGANLTAVMDQRHRRKDPDLPESGAIIDKYRLEALLGVGGFAAVYRATHLLLRIPVAIKLLRPNVLKQRPKLAELLCEEARFAAQINHPNVVRVFDVTHDPKLTYIVMEYIEGLTLADTIERRGHLSMADTIRLGLDVGAGLAAGLTQGLVHRDVKPANILISQEGRAKIVDLGMAHSELGLNRAVESGAAPILGTPAYMAPEQAAHPDQVDFRADIYSLGVTLYHAATGSPPFPLHEDTKRLFTMHRNSPVPPPSSRVAGLTPEFERLLLWMLEKDPSARPPSYDALDAHLRTILDTLSSVDDVLSKLER